MTFRSILRQRCHPRWLVAIGLGSVVLLGAGVSWFAAEADSAASATAQRLAGWSAVQPSAASCKPEPPFALTLEPGAAGVWTVQLANSGNERDLVVSVWWDQEAAAPSVLWRGRLQADETRSIALPRQAPAGSSRLWIAAEVPAAQPDLVLRRVLLMQRQAPPVAAQGAIHSDPATGERVLDLPGELGGQP